MAKFTSAERKARILELIGRLESQQVVSKRDFAIAVGNELAMEYDRRWNEQREIRNTKAPVAVKEYEAMLKKALLMDGRYEATLGSKGTKKLGTKAESLFEDALTRLEEIISADQTLRVWFDRDIDFDVEGGLGHNAGQMPRVITSKSIENKMRGTGKKQFGLQTITEIKLAILKEALKDVEHEMLTDEEKLEIKQEHERNMQKLKGLMAKLGK